MQGEGRKFGVSRWAAWPPAGGSAAGKPDLTFIPPLLRRRLSRLSGIALYVAHECLADARGIPVVFASRHGELSRTAQILTDLARCEPISPTAFSLSVHNSAVGLLALAHKDRAESTAIAAGTMTLTMGLLESIVQAQESNGKALLVYAEETPPELYRDVILDEKEDTALALLLDVDRGEFSLAAIPGQAKEESAGITQVAALAAVLAGSADMTRLGDATAGWQVTRHAQAA